MIRLAPPPIARVVVIAVSLLAMAAVSAQAQEKDVIIIEEPRLAFDLSGVDAKQIQVFIDGEFANDFLKFADNKLVLDLPFTSSKKPFNITVRLAGSGKVLVNQNYRFPPGVVFDYEKFEFHALETVTWKPTSQVSPSQAGLERSDLDHDFQGSAAFEGASENWSAAGWGVFQGTNDDRVTLRPGGSKLDLQDGQASLAYHDEQTQVRLSAGDIAIQGDNPLINLGYKGRGIGLSSSFFQQRLKVRVANTHGRDIRGFQRGLGQNPDNQRMTVDVSVDALRTEPLTVGLSGSFMMAERPAEQDFGIGGINENEKNRTFGTGLALGMFGGRLKSQSHIAWSEFESPPEAGAIDIGETTGHAQEHRVDAILWKEDTWSVTAFGAYGFFDTLYRSTQADPAADRETYEIGGGVNWSWGQFTLGRHNFETNVADSNAFIAERATTYEAILTLSLESYRQAPAKKEGEVDSKSNWPRQLIPSTVSLSLNQTNIDTTNAAAVLANPALLLTVSDLPEQVTRNAVLDLAWSWPNALSAINFNVSRIDDQTSGFETADTDSESVQLTQSFSGEVWDINGNLGASRTHYRETGANSKDYILSAGLSGSLRLEDWPDFTAFGQWRHQSIDYLFDGTDGLDITRLIGATLDFTKYLPGSRVTQVGNVQPFLMASWQYQESSRTDPASGKSYSSNYSILLTGGFQF